MVEIVINVLTIANGSTLRYTILKKIIDPPITLNNVINLTYPKRQSNP